MMAHVSDLSHSAFETAMLWGMLELAPSYQLSRADCCIFRNLGIQLLNRAVTKNKAL